MAILLLGSFVYFCIELSNQDLLSLGVFFLGLIVYLVIYCLYLARPKLSLLSFPVIIAIFALLCISYHNSALKANENLKNVISPGSSRSALVAYNTTLATREPLLGVLHGAFEEARYQERDKARLLKHKYENDLINNTRRSVACAIFFWASAGTFIIYIFKTIILFIRRMWQEPPLLKEISGAKDPESKESPKQASDGVPEEDEDTIPEAKIISN